MSSDQTFNTENLTVTVARQPGLLVKMHVAVEPAAVQAAYEKAVKQISKEVSIPGFRKGKAPKDVIEKNYQKHIAREWQEILLNTAWKEALSLTGLSPYNQNKINVSNVQSPAFGKQMSFTVEYEAYPQIPKVDLSGVELKNEPAAEIKDEDVEKTIRDIRLFFARFEDVNQRGVQEGDYVHLDIKNLDEQTMLCKNARFHVAQGEMADWMRNLILGKNQGDSVSGISEKDKKAESAAPFVPTRCEITIGQIQTAELPEVTDEFAMKVGAPNALELAVRVRKDLERKALEENQEQLRLQVAEIVLEKYPFEIPASLIEENKKSVVEQKIEALKKKEMPEEMIQRQKEALEQEAFKSLEKGYRWQFLASQFAGERGIQVENDELVQALISEYVRMGFSEDLVKQMPDQYKEEYAAQMASRLLSKKVKDAMVALCLPSEKL